MVTNSSHKLERSVYPSCMLQCGT